ncbi:MAG: hypothetical protein GXP43_03540 [bacterium]|nr:hypothetical protein [bacterium]
MRKELDKQTALMRVQDLADDISNNFVFYPNQALFRKLAAACLSFRLNDPTGLPEVLAREMCDFFREINKPGRWVLGPPNKENLVYRKQPSDVWAVIDPNQMGIILCQDFIVSRRTKNPWVRRLKIGYSLSQNPTVGKTSYYVEGGFGWDLREVNNQEGLWLPQLPSRVKLEPLIQTPVYSFASATLLVTDFLQGVGLDAAVFEV